MRERFNILWLTVNVYSNRSLRLCCTAIISASQPTKKFQIKNLYKNLIFSITMVHNPSQQVTFTMLACFGICVMKCSVVIGCTVGLIL